MLHKIVIPAMVLSATALRSNFVTYLSRLLTGQEPSLADYKGQASVARKRGFKMRLHEAIHGPPEALRRKERRGLGDSRLPLQRLWWPETGNHR